MLSETYRDHAPSISTCEYWFRRFKSGDFDVEDKERPGQLKRFEDEELEALLDEGPYSSSVPDSIDAFEASIKPKTHGIREKTRQGNFAT